MTARTPRTSAARAAIAFYRLLLHLYPRGFLADWRHELVATFAERARDHRGPLAFVALVAAAVADVVPNALAAHRDMLRQDLRYASRTLGRTPGFAITAILLVALGVGANTAAFSLADHVFVRPLPYPDADRLVKVFQTTPGYGRVELSPLHLRGWQPATRAFAAFGAYHASAVNLVGAAEPRRVQVARVTPEVMTLVGVPALIGRRIEAADSSDERIVVLSWALWQAHFGGGTDVIGRAVRLDGHPHTVVGVMPSTYRFPTREVEAWMPLHFEPNALLDRGNSYLAGIGRLAPGVTVERARDELSGIARRQAEADAVDEATGANVYRLRDEVGTCSRAPRSAARSSPCDRPLGPAATGSCGSWPPRAWGSPWPAACSASGSRSPARPCSRSSSPPASLRRSGRRWMRGCSRSRCWRSARRRSSSAWSRRCGRAPETPSTRCGRVRGPAAAVRSGCVRSSSSSRSPRRW